MAKIEWNWLTDGRTRPTYSIWVCVCVVIEIFGGEIEGEECLFSGDFQFSHIFDRHRVAGHLMQMFNFKRCKIYCVCQH